MPNHATASDSEIHYCKHITVSTTADSGKVITPSSSTNGISTLRKLNDLDFDYTTKANNLFGWNDIADSTYTSGSPRAISSGVRTLLTNNAAAAQTDTSRLGTIWNVGGSYFQVDDLNAFYIVRTQMKVTAAAAAGTPYIITFEVESSNGPTVISGNTQFIKGGGSVNWVSFLAGIYMGSTINNTQLKVYATPDTNVNIYDIGFVVERTYREK